MSTDTELRIAPDLAFPLDAVTETFLILGKRGSGKTSTATVLTEQMIGAGLPVCVIDPTGDWWGLRSSKDGTGAGLAVPIFGGLHGDMPLVPEAGKLVAELITGENLTCVLDVSEFSSKAAQMRFLADLGEQLFRLHGRNPQPRHLFLEEADDNRKATRRKAAYGLTQAEFDVMWEAQDGKCAICPDALDDSVRNGLHVDHCHFEREVRGLLCGRCNVGLGQFRDDPELLMAAAAYLMADHWHPSLESLAGKAS